MIFLFQIAAVGDSITAGALASDSSHAYPQQLQALLDATHGTGAYEVTNLGEGGATMQKGADSPYWDRSSYTTLIENTWDIVVIMLGTNDAKDAASGGPPNWQHDCSHPDGSAFIEGCTFAEDYASFIDVVSTLGRKNGTSPLIYTMIPAPLMELGSIGANNTVINTIYPQLIPLIKAQNRVDGLVDIFTVMGGRTAWESDFPKKCTLNSLWAPCGYFCDEQSCDQCHPNDVGYKHMALAVQAGLGLM